MIQDYRTNLFRTLFVTIGLLRPLNENNKPREIIDEDNLKFFYKMSTKEIDFLRDRQYKIFIWVSSILLASLGILLINDEETHLVFGLSEPINQWIFSFAVMIISCLSIQIIYKNRLWHEDHKVILTKIGIRLNAYKKGNYQSSTIDESLFPEKWIRPKTIHLFTSSYNIVILILSILTIIAIWLTPQF